MSDIPYGYCGCGCGEKTTIVKETNQGTKKGEPRKFIFAHHQRVRYGKMPERFWDKVDIRGPDECWPWKDGLTSEGYGAFNAKGYSKYAHRVAYLLTYGPIPEGLLIRHTCDSRPCNNPAHLLTGTDADNSRDKMDRGRFRPNGLFGETHPMAKVTEKIVKKIRELRSQGYMPAEIKSMLSLDIDRHVVGAIARRKIWKHVP